MNISLNGSDWSVQGWVPQEWELVGVRQLVTANLDIGKMLNGETGELQASVPGCVQADLVRNGICDDPYTDINSRKMEWAQHRNWLYQKKFTIPADAAGKKLRLIFKGIDYSARVWLNAQLLGRHEGTFVPAEFDITNVARFGEENHLIVMIDPAPDVPGQVGYSDQVRHLKPRFSYKWDFTTRLVPLGLWDDVQLAVTGPAHIDTVFVQPENDGRVRVSTTIASAETTRAKLRVRILLDENPVAEKELAITAGTGSAVYDLSLNVQDPQLWWPIGLGEQPLYTAEVTLLNDEDAEWDASNEKFGFRSIKMIQNEDAPEGADPYTMVVNGRKIFLRGWNFVPVDHMYGLPNVEKYEWLIELARRANVNMLRVWGGGIIEKEIFYDLCDRAGILVWQEMPQSSSGLSNEPPSEPGFLETLKATAKSALRRRRNHACLAIWCAGNELADVLDPLDITHPNLAAIGKAVEEEAPHLVYRPTSPYGPAYDPAIENFGKGVHHDIHGPWKYQGVEGQYELFNGNDCLFHSESGAEGCAAISSIKRCLPNESPWPPDKSNRAWAHHAGWWINTDMITEQFGEFDSLDPFVMATQFMQAEALRYVIESNRRRQFHCSGSLLWQMNEPWPQVSATTSVDYYGVPKPAYYFVGRACKPRHVSLKYSRLNLVANEPFEAEIFAHNSLTEIQGEVTCRVFDQAGQPLADEIRQTLSLAENSCLSVGKVSFTPPAGVAIVRLELLHEGELLSRNEYVFPVGGRPVLAPLRNLAETKLAVRSISKTPAGAVVTVANDGAVAALMTLIEPEQNVRLYAENNVRMLLPGEEASFDIICKGTPTGKIAVVKAWNAAPQDITL